MGEVYRARETRLDRDVAVKLVPEIHPTPSPDGQWLAAPLLDSTTANR
jgi:hypothetical protein